MYLRKTRWLQILHQTSLEEQFHSVFQNPESARNGKKEAGCLKHISPDYGFDSALESVKQNQEKYSCAQYPERKPCLPERKFINRIDYDVHSECRAHKS